MSKKSQLSTLNSQLKVLFLTPWYPHRYDAMAGLFVRKHAQAVARQGVDVGVLYLHITDQVAKDEFVETEIDGVKELILYSNNGGFKKELSLVFKMYKYWKKKYWKPNVIHVQVLTIKWGILASFLSLSNIPYFITEHWSGYLPENGDIQKKSIFYRLIMKYIAYNAKLIMPVSNHLMAAMQNLGIRAKFMKLNNVVDDFFYDKCISKEMRTKKRILHVSCFSDHVKNIKGQLRVVKKISKIRRDFEYVIVGTGIDFDECVNYAWELGLSSDIVKFVGEQTPLQVYNWMVNSDFFVLFSNYENAPVVISEALAVGLPIVSSNVGGISEMINEEIGFLIDRKDEKALKEKILYLLDNFQKYDIEKIRNNGLKYSFDRVGHQLVEIYRSQL